jgi:hypothetical protein
MGNWIEDSRFARLSALIVNMVKLIWAKKGTYQWSSPEEFMPDWKGDKVPKKKQSVEEMKQVLQNIARYSKKGKKNG